MKNKTDYAGHPPDFSINSVNKETINEKPEVIIAKNIRKDNLHLFNRRNFIKTGLIGTAGSLSALSLKSCSEGDSEYKKECEVEITSAHSDKVNSVCFNSDGTRFISGSDDGIIKIWNISDGTLLGSIDGYGGQIKSAFYSTDDSKIIAAYSDNTIKIFNAASSNFIMEMNAGVFYSMILRYGMQPAGILLEHLPDIQIRSMPWPLVRMELHSFQEVMI